jgi:acyl-CoA synthetase (AMP-forming)/AMP-acid ligase II
VPRLVATWTPTIGRHYRRPGGPWEGPTLDELLSRPRPRSPVGPPGPGATVLVDGDRRLAHEAVESLVARLAGGLRHRKVRRGDVVSWRLPNSLAAALLFRACWRIGAVPAPVLHSLGDAETRAALAQVEPVLELEIEGAASSDPDRLLAMLGGPPVSAGCAARGGDLAVVLFTSGTTGVPKAVLHTHRGLSWKARLMARVHDLGPADAVLMPAPMAHIAGLLNGVLLPGAAGMKSVLVRRFDAEQAVRLVATERVSFLAGPPTFFVAMAAARDGAPPTARPDTSSLRLISSGGAAVTPAFVESTTTAFGCRVKRTYGSTEAPTVTTSTDRDPFEQARDTEGRAVGEVELRTSEPATGRATRSGEPGELWVRGPELFVGYVDTMQTRATTARGGWFRTGDLATVDGEGWLRIVGRLKDVIIRGGENISASEVQGLLEAHPSVLHAAVVGYPDPLMGERVAAFVEAGGSFDLEACRRWFVERGVARFKTPELVVHLERIPLLGSGKPDRGALLRLAAARAQADG